MPAVPPPSEDDDDLPTDAGAPVPTPSVDAARVRLQRWRDQLLDLSLHNRLLNFRPTVRTSVELRVADLQGFAAHLAEGLSLQLDEAPAGGVGSVHAHDDTVERARALDRACRVDREEGGANTCFAAIGVLRWVDPVSGQARLAPLLMVPVRVQYNRLTRAVSVERAEEDPVGNVTLVEKMRRDFGLDLSALGQVGGDEGAEVDVAALLDAVGAAVSGMANWSVEHRVFLGRLLFTKFIAWTDLDQHGPAILSNPVVRHIATAGAEPLADPGPARLDALDAMPLVLDADATQSGAVASALAGRTMVIQGPPGTGKSQTITNLVAAAVAAGKTVLFVSEKLAALEVVHRRLLDVGLGDYCLELHSQKANKRDVARSLAAALDRAESTPDPGWDERAAALGALRAPLDAAVAALHRARPEGASLHAGMERLLELQSAPAVEGALAPGAALDEAAARAMAAAVATLQAVAAPVEPAAAHPWRDASASAWTDVLDADLRTALEAAHHADARARDATDALAALLGVLVTPAHGPVVVELGEALVAAPPGALPSLDTRDTATAWLRRAQADADARAELATRWTPRFVDADLPGALAAFRAWSSAFFLLAFLFLFFPRQRLSALARGPLGPSARVRDDLEVHAAVRAAAAEIAAGRAALVPSFAGAWDGVSLEQLGQVLAAQGRLAAAAAACEAAGVPVPGALEGALDGARAELAPAVARARRALDEKHDAFTRVEALAGVPEVGDVEARLAAVARFRPWCLYRAAAERVAAAGLPGLARAHAEGALAAHELQAAAERAVVAAWTQAARAAEPVLAAFSGPAHHLAVRQFEVADRAHLAHARAFVLSRLDARRPSLAVEGSEAGIVAREAKKQRAHWPIRRLLGAVPNLLPRLKPCCLMSPLSVAQYLPPGGRRFDLVVFDEASQIGTHDAVGALARGHSAVIVGDSRQLPPTRFFQSESADAADDEAEVVELESILDEAVASRLPQQLLGWHYRSRHQALIAFSNEHFYESRLHVFPAARDAVDDLGVRYHPVAGVYGRGGSRQNREEAEALVGWLVTALQSRAPGERSFGVVTFSVAQQALVEDLLDDARGAHPEIEPHFASDLHEPVFVKNLENVQGDERDEILFSICYGPDPTGVVAMNFGPLNKPGGERRLNVAVTRARRCLRVFSSLSPDRIDLAKTAAAGVAGLRAFLVYAQQGGPGLPGAAEAASAAGLAGQVAAELAARGYASTPRVGAGKYRVDLAVHHPERPGEYLLGIEFDGLTYAQAATTRDRDRLRAQVLSGLGWRLARVWLLDWWFDRDGETGRLLRELERAREGGGRPAGEARAPAPSTTSTAPARLPVASPSPTVPARSPGAARRDAGTLAPRDVDAALLAVLQGAVAIDEDACKKLAARHLGFTRRGARIDAALDAGVARLLDTGKAKREGRQLVCARP